MRLYPILLLLFAATLLHAQSGKFTISGTIEDDASGEKMIGASVFDLRTKKGTTTNTYGFFSLTLPADSVQLLISSLGFAPQTLGLKLDKDIQMSFKLKTNVELGTVEVIGERLEKIEERTQMSMVEIPVEQIKSIPALLGEVDVLKVLQLLPGVQSGGEGSSGFYVRGGGPDQNLILLDGAPVYNASHLFGFFSVFNADAIKNVELIKGGFPAHYGGRLSSIVDINMKEGNMKKFHGEGSIGIIAAKLTLEAPIKKDHTSFIISGRRTYIDILAAPFVKKQSGGNSGGYYFYDLNAKINTTLGPKDRLYLSAYGGDDQFYVKTEDKFQDQISKFESKAAYRIGWGNITSTLRWNHIHNAKLFSNVSLIYSKFRFFTDIETREKMTQGTQVTENNFNLKYLSGINDFTGKIDFDYMPDPDHKIKFGAADIYHTFNTGAMQYKVQATGNTDIDTTLGVNNVYAHELSGYFEDDYRVSDKLKVNAGVHGSAFVVPQETYWSVQPRFSSRYLLPNGWSAKASFATMQQYIHLLSNSNIGLPTDLWVPSTSKVKPQFSIQYAVGTAKTLFDDKFEVSLEGYYKEMKNLIDYLEGANFMDAEQDWQNKVENGKGWAYGTEFFVQKKKGKLTGWVGYTLSWSKRQFPNINEGKVYPYKYDRRHDASIVMTYKIRPGIDLAATWVFGTGNSISLPIAEYPASDLASQSFGHFGGGPSSPESFQMIEYYGSKNSFRMAAYHRLDLGVNFTKFFETWQRTWSIGVYNAYNRKNPYFIYSGYKEDGTKAFKQVSLFPIIPSFTYSFKF